jgi:DNA-directed RNA polymerase subunit RPC12/RpoP
VEWSPRMVEYVCLACGVQGLIDIHELQTQDQDTDDSNQRVTLVLRCPKCNGEVVSIERKGTSNVLAVVHA